MNDNNYQEVIGKVMEKVLLLKLNLTSVPQCIHGICDLHFMYRKLFSQRLAPARNFEVVQPTVSGSMHIPSPTQ